MEGTGSAIIKKQPFLVHDYHGYTDFSRINSEACMQKQTHKEPIISENRIDSSNRFQLMIDYDFHPMSHHYSNACGNGLKSS